MYIVFDKDTKRVFGKSEKPFIKLGENMQVVEYYGEIPICNYLTVTNLRQETGTKIVEKLNENNEPIFDENGETITEEIPTTYITCDLVANFNPPLTAEQIEKQKKVKYELLCLKYIRELYSATDENKIVREYLADMSNAEKKAQFDKYNLDVENCKQRAKAEINTLTEV